MADHWLKQRLREIGKTQVGLARHMGVEAPRITELMREGPTSGPKYTPPIHRIPAMAEYLELPIEELVRRISGENPRSLAKSTQPRSRVKIVGYVQAGIWREAMMLEQEDQGYVDLLPDPEYPELPRFALRNVGSSMNKRIPDGAIVICIKLIDIGRDPLQGEIVEVIRRTEHGLVEATLKEYVKDPDTGKVELWPRSTDPQFQTPLKLRSNGEEDDVLVQAVVRSHFADDRPPRR